MLAFKSLYLTFGITFLVVGIIGVFLPLLPTTPFLLLAAVCFSRSSSKFHNWLLSHKHFGPPIKDWNEHGVIGKRAKFLAILFMSISMGYAFFFKLESWVVRLAVAMCWAVLVWFIASRPSERGMNGK